MSREDIIQKLQDANTRKKFRSTQIAHVRLAWSFARWENHRHSDIDIIYEKDTSLPRQARWIVPLYPYLENKLKRKVELIKKEMIHPAIQESLLADAIQLW